VNNIPDFHDGFFDGLWISDQKRIHVFLRAADKKPFTLILHGAMLLNASNVKQANIILDLVVLDAEHITAEHIGKLYELGAQREEKIEQFWASAQHEGLNVLELSSSYGADCIALFRRAELLAKHVLS
jgi:hypothetical protein